jgi:hypothetical protein
MKRKVKITKLPEFSKGGMHLGDQQNYGLYRGGGYLQDYVTGTEVPSDKDIRSSYPEVDREDASIEVEKGEKILLPDFSGLYNVGGKPHSKGGTPVYAQGGEYVFSNYITMPKPLQDSLGFKGKSSKKKDNTIAVLLGNKVDSQDYNRLSQILQDANDGKPVDQFELKSAQIRFPEYMQTMQKAMVGGELSKAMQGKEFKIPDNAMPALQKLQEQSNKEKISEQPLVEAKEGGSMNKQLRITGMGIEKYQEKGEVKKKLKRAELSGFLKANPDYKQDPNNPNRYVKKGTPGSSGVNKTSTPGSGHFETGARGTFHGRGGKDFDENDVINNPNVYKSFHQWMKGAPADVMNEAAKAYVKGYRNMRWVPGTPTVKEEPWNKPGTPDDEILVEDEIKPRIPYVPGTTPPPSYTYPGSSRKPWWTQDELRLMQALTQYPKAQYPTLQQVHLPQTDPVVIEPYYAPITGQAASARNVAAATSSPQMLRNFLSGTQPIDAVANLTYQTAAANAQRVQQAREQNAQIAGQEALTNASLRGKYISDVDRVTGELNKEKEMYSNNRLGAVMQGMTNANKTQAWNDSFGRMYGYNINPDYTQDALTFRGGHNIYSPGQQQGMPSMDQVAAQYRQLGEMFGNNTSLINDFMRMNYPQLGGRSTVKSDGSGNYDASYSQPGMMQAIMQQLSESGAGY